MSNFNIVCDNCGRWVQGITWVNGMKFCAKCYQETFGASKDWQLLDKDKTIAEQQKQIAELEEQLKNAIVPKFKIGQECYLIDDNFNYFHNRKEYNIVRSKIRKHKNVYYIEDYGINHEEDLFATKEEAQAKLEEL